MVSGSQGKSEARWSTRTPPSAPARAASARQSVYGVLLNEATATVSPERTMPSASSAVASRSRCRSRHHTGAASPGTGRLSRRIGRRIASSAMLETALHSHLAARGAVHVAERGVVLPRRFGDDPAAEYAALREGAVLVDLGFRALVRATGTDRVTFLHGMLTNDIASLAPGSGCPALLLTIQGGVTAGLRVAALGDALLLDGDVRARAALVEALEKLIIADDVELREPGEPLALIGVEGPGAARLLPGAAGLAPYAHAVVTLAGVPVRAQRASEVRRPGFVLHAPGARAAAVWDALLALGARPCGMEALESRRVEVGVPRVGVDMDGATLALEVPVEDAISATKGCYLGQEVVARGTARGHVNRRLVGLRLEGAEPSPGAPLVHDAKEVGRLTSVVRSFGGGGLAALGFVRREHWEPRTELRGRHGQPVRAPRAPAFPLA